MVTGRNDNRHRGERPASGHGCVQIPKGVCRDTVRAAGLRAPSGGAEGPGTEHRSGAEPGEGELPRCSAPRHQGTACGQHRGALSAHQVPAQASLPTSADSILPRAHGGGAVTVSGTSFWMKSLSFPPPHGPQMLSRSLEKFQLSSLVVAE